MLSKVGPSVRVASLSSAAFARPFVVPSRLSALAAVPDDQDQPFSRWSRIPVSFSSRFLVTLSFSGEGQPKDDLGTIRSPLQGLLTID